MKPQRVLFVASEASPLIKVGGLADVVGALPQELEQFGVAARVCIPKYGTIPVNQLKNVQTVLQTTIPWQGGVVSVELQETTLPGTSTVLYLLDAPRFFGEGGVYYEHDKEHGVQLAMERFVFFSWAMSRIIPQLQWQPDLVHCHDWHTALIPSLLPLADRGHRPTILTIHNIEGQGKWRAEEVFTWLGITGHEHPSLTWRDAGGNLNALQLGIRAASAVNTVSPTYAHEILSPQYGMGLERDLAERPGGVIGILNGIDFRVFDPANDTRLFSRYDVATADVGKLKNKHALYRELGLRNGKGPLFVVIGRLTSQKGVDHIPTSIPDIVQADGRLVILGSGVPDVERAIADAIAPYPEHCRALVRFDADLAQRMYAAADFFLMPSRFEPCGLGQLVAMRYGTLPIVRDTGGLHDTVRNIRRHRDGTGFVFGPATSTALRTAVQDALRIFRQPDTMNAARTRAMNQDFSWHRSAQEYVTLYTNAR